VRTRLRHQPRRLAQALALAALAGGVLPTTAAVADGATATRAQPAAAAGWSLVATLDPAHTTTLDGAHPAAVPAELILYGAYIFTPDMVNFDPTRIPGSVVQQVVPNIVVPNPDGHTYKAVFHLATDVTASRTTRYQFRSQPPVTVADGVADLEFTETVTTQGWHGFSLRNAVGNHWLWYRCDIYELTN
jgi:hypothetical protein